MALEEMAWTNDAEFMRIIDGRRYMYKGVKRGIAIDGNISAYELGIPFTVSAPVSARCAGVKPESLDDAREASSLD